MEPITNSSEKQEISLLDLDALHRPIMGEIEAACREVIGSGRFILGPNVGAFEEELSGYCRADYGVGVASGTDALHLCLRALEIGPGDEVITTPFTFCATADSILMAGATPVFADIDPLTFNLDPRAVEAAVTDSTRAIIPVHLYGRPADMDALRAIASRHDLALIEDNAQALGAWHNGRKTGSLGDAAAVSFFPSKNLGGFGDGGMVVTSDAGIAGRVRSLRAHGAVRKYFSTELGVNSRLDELQAAILRVKLPYLDEWNRKRRENARFYNELFASEDKVVAPAEADDGSHVFHQYTIRLPERDLVREALKSLGIATAVYYPEPLHLQPLFAGLGYREGTFPHAESACREVLSLPAGPELGEADVEIVAAAVIRTVRGL